jgi:hypothetical protein
MLYDSFSDILKHTNKLGFIDAVKISYDEENNTNVVEATLENAVVIKGVLNDPIDGIDCTIGLSRMNILSGYLNFQPFNTDKASIIINRVKRSEGDVPSDVVFDSGVGHTASYRLMSGQMAEAMVDSLEFIEPKWDITFKPTKQAVADFSSLKSIMGSSESVFCIEKNGDDIDFVIGGQGSDKSKVTFAKNIKGDLKHKWSWSIANFLPILKLIDSSQSVEINISDKGIAKIVVVSGIGTYSYMVMKSAV